MTVTITAEEYRKGFWKDAKGPHRIIPTPLDGEAVNGGALCLTTIPPSLNNAFINLPKGKGRTKSPEYRQWINGAQRDLRKQEGWHVPGHVAIKLAFRRGGTGADLDNLIKPCLDILVSTGRITDDRNVVKIEAQFSDDLKGVRIEIQRAA